MTGDIILYETHGLEIVLPAFLPVPFSEGYFFFIREKENPKHWRKTPLKRLLQMVLLSLATATIDAEYSLTEDLWANIHFRSAKQIASGVCVFGRNPHSSAWGKVVRVKGKFPRNLSLDTQRKLVNAFKKHMPLWENFLAHMTLFDNGIEEIIPGAKNYEKEVAFQESINAHLLWSTQRFGLVTIPSPHLNGLHIIISPRLKYWHQYGGLKRFWQISTSCHAELVSASQRSNQGSRNTFGMTNGNVPLHLQGFLEGMAIGLAVDRLLLQKYQLPYFHPEIHFSHNWALDLQLKKRGGKLDAYDLLSEEVLIASKKKYTLGGKEEWQTSAHGHFYATKDPNREVDVPLRPENEMPSDWQVIMPMTQPEVIGIQKILERELSAWLEKEALGKLVV